MKLIRFRARCRLLILNTNRWFLLCLVLLKSQQFLLRSVMRYLRMGRMGVTAER
jgi:hypothetical protein